MEKSGVPWWAVILWQMLATHSFFTMGHQATFPTINWEAAFTGFHGDYGNNVMPGVLLLANTFASNIIFTLATPLLVIWPFSHGRILAHLGE